MEIKTIKKEASGYPEVLKEIQGAPKELFVLGNLDNSLFPGIAIVGTRKATNAGVKTAERFAKEFALRGLTVISGLAMGIDTAAHNGALDGGGKTVAVLGSPINKIYPAQNIGLAKEIIENDGAVISEYATEASSHKGSFPARNRIISGLSTAVVVIESPEKSGSLITAGHAADQGRTVFVVPGDISNKNYAGSHALIRDGATLVTSAEDVLEDLGFENSIAKPEIEIPGINKYDIQIIEAIKTSGEPINADAIIKTTKLNPQIVNASLAVLVINNVVAEESGKYTLLA